MEKMIDMCNAKDIKEYYNERSELRSKYTNENLIELKDAIDNEIKQNYGDSMIQSIDIDGYTLIFKFNHKHTQEVIDHIHEIVTSNIFSKFGISIPCADLFVLGDILKIMI